MRTANGFDRIGRSGGATLERHEHLKKQPKATVIYNTLVFVSAVSKLTRGEHSTSAPALNARSAPLEPDSLSLKAGELAGAQVFCKDRCEGQQENPQQSPSG